MFSLNKFLSFALKTAAIGVIGFGCFKLGVHALSLPEFSYQAFTEALMVAITMAVTGSAVYCPEDEDDDV